MFPDLPAGAPGLVTPWRPSARAVVPRAAHSCRKTWPLGLAFPHLDPPWAEPGPGSHDSHRAPAGPAPAARPVAPHRHPKATEHLSRNLLDTSLRAVTVSSPVSPQKEATALPPAGGQAPRPEPSLEAQPVAVAASSPRAPPCAPKAKRLRGLLPMPGQRLELRRDAIVWGWTCM